MFSKLTDEVLMLVFLLGIWMCKGKGMNVLVMDVEGTDGRERGEDQVSELLLDMERRLTFCCRTSSASLRCFRWLPPKFSS